MGQAVTSDPAHFAQLDKSALIRFMDEIRYIIIAKQCEVAGTSSILDGRLKKSFSEVVDRGKQFFDTHLVSMMFLAT